MRQIIDFRLAAQIGRTRKTARFFKTHIGFVRRFRLAYPNDFLDAGLFFSPFNSFCKPAEANINRALQSFKIYAYSLFFKNVFIGTATAPMAETAK